MQDRVSISNDLSKSVDAVEWASEFNKVYPELDNETLVTWFTAALMSGYLAGKKDARESIEAMQRWRNL